MTAILEIPTQTWENCYSDSWKHIITPESFSHPAKAARGLLCRILDFMLAEGWIKKGDLCADPFAGVGTTGIECASRGIRFVGCELESRFVAFAEANFELHRRKWEQFGDPLPRIIQGDSRKLREVLQDAGSVEAVVSSPPFAMGDKRGPGSHIASEDDVLKGSAGRIGKSCIDGNYGTTEGQLGSLPAGSVEAVLSSQEKIDGMISSPPYEGIPIAQFVGKNTIRDNPAGALNDTMNAIGYGHTEGQLGSESGDTFWSAARQILTECFAILRPNSYACFICNDFVRDGQRVAFSADWLKLCLAVGFEPVLWVKASLVKAESHAGLFGESIVQKRERKSFFRRLAEKKMAEDDPRRIDHEDCLFLRRS